MFPDISFTRQHLLASVVLILTLVTGFGTAGLCAPKNLTKGELVLSDKTPALFPASSMRYIEDPAKKLSYSDVISHFQSGNINSYPAGKTDISFGLHGMPTWFVLPVNNQSKTAEFVFSLNGGPFQTQGLIKNLFIYDADTGKVLYQNLNKSGREATPPYIPFTLAPGKATRLILYMEPSSYWPVIITPQLLTHDEALREAYFSNSITNLFLLLMTGVMIASLAIFAIHKPGLACYIIQLLALLLLLNLHKSGAGLAFLPEAIIPLLLLTTASTGLLGMIFQYGISWQDKNELITLLIPLALAVICALTMMWSSLDLGLINLLLTIIPLGLITVSLLILSLAMMQDSRPGASGSTAAWACMGLAIITSIFNGLDVPYIVPAIPVMFLTLHVLMINISVLLGHQDIWKSLILSFTPARLAKSMAGMNAAHEESEYNRLLNVVERERQMMAELRRIDTKRRAEMQRAKEEADAANRDKSAFLAVVSHEIRTPMTGVLGLTRMLMDTTLAAEQKGYAQAITDSGESMISLLNDILDFEKIESGKMMLEYVDFDLEQMIKSAVTLMAGHAKSKNIGLHFLIDNDVPHWVKGDPSRLRQVLLNLIGNAIKFTAEGNVTIHIGLNDVDLDQDVQGDTKAEKSKDAHSGDKPETKVPLSINVRDTGIGIAASAIEKLFDPFSQAESSTSRKYGGSGLGLAICKRLIEAMGGRIVVESEVGKGSLFCIRLAMEPGAPEQASTGERTPRIDNASEDSARKLLEETRAKQNMLAANKTSQTTGEPVAPPALDLHVLVVEDNQISQDVMRNFLKKMGMNVDIAGAGEEALDLARKTRYDLIFMDWELPGINGDQAVKTLRSSTEFASHKTPVFMLTGHRLEENETDFKPGEIQGILVKPVMPEDLEPAIRRIYPVGGYKMVASLTQPDKPAREEDNLWPSAMFDTEIMKSLTDTLGLPKLKELLGNVVEKNDDLISELKGAHERKDIDGLYSYAHELKGMTSNFGLLELQEVAKEIELAAKSLSPEKIPPLFMSLDAAQKKLQTHMGA